MEMSVGIVCVTCHADIEEEVVGRRQWGGDNAESVTDVFKLCLRARMPVSRTDVGMRA